MTEDPDMLDDLFQTARRTPAEPSSDLLARVQADALAMQPVRGAVLPAPQTGLFMRLLGALGGWPAAAGLATATVAGLWIGMFPPDLVSDGLSQVLYGADTMTVDPLGGFDYVLLEG